MNECNHTTDDLVMVCRHCDLTSKGAYTVQDDGPTVLTAEMVETAVRKLKAFAAVGPQEPLNMELMIRTKYGDKVF